MDLLVVRIGVVKASRLKEFMSHLVMFPILHISTFLIEL